MDINSDFSMVHFRRCIGELDHADYNELRSMEDTLKLRSTIKIKAGIPRN